MARLLLLLIRLCMASNVEAVVLAKFLILRCHHRLPRGGAIRDIGTHEYAPASPGFAA